MLDPLSAVPDVGLSGVAVQPALTDKLSCRLIRGDDETAVVSKLRTSDAVVGDLNINQAGVNLFDGD